MAFARLPDPKVRKRIIDLVSALAGYDISGDLTRRADGDELGN
jgi:hypothetical protein